MKLMIINQQARSVIAVLKKDKWNFRRILYQIKGIYNRLPLTKCLRLYIFMSKIAFSLPFEVIF